MMIRFTPEDALRAIACARQAGLPPIGTEHSGAVYIRIEDAPNCEGFDCREAVNPPVMPHSHIIVHGTAPETRDSILAIFRK